MDEIYFNIRKIEGSKRMTYCRVCGSSKRNDYFLITEFPSSAQGFQKSKKTAKNLKSDLDIFECSICGLTQISNQPVSYSVATFFKTAETSNPAANLNAVKNCSLR